MPQGNSQEQGRSLRPEQPVARALTPVAANGVAVQAQLGANAAFKARMLLQRRAAGAAQATDVRAAAARGVQGRGQALPHLAVIQRAFGRHDVSGVSAFVGGPARAAGEQIGAEAYATGDRVAFRDAPSLHLAAHEAAHVVQQRAGVQLSGGVGAAGDVHEQHADAVADAVVRGESAEGLLDKYAGSTATAGVQMKRRWGRTDRRNAQPALMGHVVVGREEYSVRARGVGGWKQFLSSQAFTKAGAVELVAFMAKTLRHLRLPGVPESSLENVRRPLDRQALDLMQAFLSVGSIDLADKGFEQPDAEDYPARRAAVLKTGPVMAEFNSRYAARALAEMTRTGAVGGRENHIDNVSDYAEDAADMKESADEHEGRSTDDPVQTLIAAGLATAVAGVYQVHTSSVRNRNMQQINEGYQMVRTGGMTIRGCLSQLNADQRADIGVLQKAFSISTSAAGVVGPVGKKIVGAFLSLIQAVFVAVRTDDIDRLRLQLVDRFEGAANSLLPAVGMNPDQIQIAINAFQNEVGS